jgi:penicillin-binding protein 1A
MTLSRIAKSLLQALLIICAASAVLAGIFIGVSLAMTSNLRDLDDFNLDTAALPSQVFDIKGRKITEFFADEKRILIKLNELPSHLLQALITREDEDFFQHPGFSIKGIARALFGVATGRNLGGGSTITQQLAGTLYADRSDRSFWRKLRELWFAIHLERQWTKQQILEEYINKMYFGHGTYGVEAASQFYFGHSAREISVAESAILVIQLSGSALYSPLRNAERARNRQMYVLDRMVDAGHISKAEADQSLIEFWDNFDLTRSASQSVFLNRQDHAPYFSEYVRSQVNTRWLLGDADINRDGFKIYTTLDLDHQTLAEQLLREGIDGANQTFRRTRSARSFSAANIMVPIVDALALAFDIGNIRVADQKQLNDARNYYRNTLNPIVELLGLQFSNSESPDLINVARASRAETVRIQRRNTIEGALISIDNENGYINAMVGGSRFEQRNQFNRAIQARLQPGSAYKPLYYAAAIEKNVVTAATRFYDSPVEFINDDGTLYTPNNYNGVWEGAVLVRRALYRSMNIPSIRLLNAVGFDDAIAISTQMMGIPSNEHLQRNFVRRYPLGLGIATVTPLELTRGFSVFPRLGRGTGEIGIRYIQDRFNRTIVEPEKIIRAELNSEGRYSQIISPQSAYVMSDMLASTITHGTLAGAVNRVRGLPMQMAGKTGTTQNWAAAWTVGFSAYYTSSVWFGFDEGGTSVSLGTNQTGAGIAGPVWARFMKEIHKDLPAKPLPKPSTGLNYVRVTENAGLLPPSRLPGPYPLGNI